MSADLSSGHYNIVTRDYGRFVSVNDSQSNFQPVGLDSYVPLDVWTVNPLSESNTYKLQIGGYSATGVISDEVFVSVYPEDDVAWHVTYRPDRSAYTIERAGHQNKGWTVPPEDSYYHHIVLMEFKPDFADQLFRFNPQ